MKHNFIVLRPAMYEDKEPDPTWGYIKYFLNEEDPRSAKEQFNTNYVSGWQKFDGFKMDPTSHALKYPGDPSMSPIDTMQFRDETICLYKHAWVAVVQKDGSYEVCRMD